MPWLAALALALAAYAAGDAPLLDPGWIEVRPGTAPLVLAAPHGGSLTPAALADRRRGLVQRDLATRELTVAIARAFERRTGAPPHLVLCHLHRSKLDPNRAADDAAQGDPRALAAWRAWHAALYEARGRVAARHGAGLLVDVHGHAHAAGWIELGYALPRADLARPDRELRLGPLMNPSSVRALAARHDGALAPILRGPQSLGALLEAAGYPSVPSPARPHPGARPYFDGGYDTRRHGSRADGTVDALQLEVPRGLRADPARRARLAEDVAAALERYLTHWYGWRPPAALRATAATTADPPRR